jgi:hypothetical protein
MKSRHAKKGKGDAELQPLGIPRLPGGKARGEMAVQLLRGTGGMHMTTDEIMALTRDLPDEFEQAVD